MSRTRTYLNVGHGEPPLRVRISAYPTAAPLATVALDGDRLEVTGHDPAHLRCIAEAFTDAARQLSDELDKHAARQVNEARIIGGASCPCGSRAQFASDEARETWEQDHAECAA